MPYIQSPTYMTIHERHWSPMKSIGKLSSPFYVSTNLDSVICCNSIVVAAKNKSVMRWPWHIFVVEKTVLVRSTAIQRLTIAGEENTSLCDLACWSAGLMDYSYPASTHINDSYFRRSTINHLLVQDGSGAFCNPRSNEMIWHSSQIETASSFPRAGSCRSVWGCGRLLSGNHWTTATLLMFNHRIGRTRK